MTRLLGWAFLTVVVLLLLGLTALVLLGTSPGWLAQSRHGEQAYEVLVVLAALGLRVWPVLLGAAVLLGSAWVWRRWTAARRAT